MRIILLLLFAGVSYGLLAQSPLENQLDSLNEVFRDESNPDRLLSLLDAGKTLLNLSLDSARQTFKMASQLSEDGSILQAKGLSYEGLCYAFMGKSDSSNLLQRQALNIAEQLLDYDLTTIIYGNMGINFSIAGQYDSALVTFDNFLNLAKEAENQADIAMAANNIGLTHLRNGNYYLALSGFIEAEMSMQVLQDTFSLSKVYQNLSIVYRDLGDYDKSVAYTKKSIAIKTSLEDKVGLLKSYINLATIYHEHDVFDSAEFFLRSALPLAREVNDPLEIVSIHITQMRTCNETQRPQQAINLGNESLRILDKTTGIEIYGRLIIELAHAYALVGQYSKAKAYIDEAIILCEENGFNQAAEWGFRVKSKVYAGMGDLSGALTAFKQYHTVRDSIATTGQNRLIAQLETQFQLHKKDEKITQQRLDISSKAATIAGQQNTILLIGSGAGFIFLFGLLFYNYKKSQQQQKLQAAISLEKERGYTSVLHATEEERSRISKDLHDGIGQQLSVLKLGLNALSEKISDNKIKSEIEEISASFSESADEVRHISHQMMPRALAEKGLIVATEELLKNAFEHSDMKYQLEYDGIEGRLPESIEISIFRVIQELVNNIIKHAKATQVNVQLVLNKDRLLIFIEDNGKGFDTSTDFQGHGLLNIKSRVDMIHGTVNFEPGPTAGTFVSITIPLANYA